jgi:hypothetical protein
MCLKFNAVAFIKKEEENNLQWKGWETITNNPKLQEMNNNKENK